MGQSAQIIALDHSVLQGEGLSTEALIAANINPDTFLATDYLNHYNEVIMMIDMLPDMPDCLEDVEDWSPKSYADHFRDSCFQAKDLAIMAYDQAAPHVQAHFEYVCNRLDARISSLTVQARQYLDCGDMDRFRLLCEESGHKFAPLLDELNAIIHGSMDSSAHMEPVCDLDHTQAEIDALFD